MGQPDTSPNGWAHAFQVNKEAFETWAKRDGIGGGCGGFCQKLQLTTPSGYTGATFTMRCVISRMKKVWDQGIPGYLEGLERIETNTKCDVSCSTNESNWKTQGCEFLVSTIFFYSIGGFFGGFFRPVLIYILFVVWQVLGGFRCCLEFGSGCLEGGLKRVGGSLR